MTTLASPWPAARQAYYTHHAACGQCQAARAASPTQQRCPEGLALWDTYNQAGDPPHFVWVALAKRFKKP